jgi:hypothetical protein
MFEPAVASEAPDYVVQPIRPLLSDACLRVYGHPNCSRWRRR